MTTPPPPRPSPQSQSPAASSSSTPSNSHPHPLTRAHALSAQASVLLRPPVPTLPALQQALQAYREAADLYDSAATAAGGGGGAEDATANTLRLLVNQHRRLAKDVERRIASASGSPATATAVATQPASPDLHLLAQDRPGGLGRPAPAPAAAPETGKGGASASAGRTGHPSLFRRATDGVGLGLGAAGSLGNSPWQAPGIASRLSPPRGIPPFALRPPPPLSPSSSVPFHINSPPAMPVPNPFPDTTLSPLHSSSSSSEAPEESYVHFGAVPDTLDPFSHFWGRLENMLEDISNPVAFASVPLDIPLAPPPPVSLSLAGVASSGAERRKKEKKIKSKGKEEKRRLASPIESFYVVQRDQEGQGGGDDDGSDELPSGKLPSTSTGTGAASTTKTPEELSLENTSLRSSLDAIASHAQALDQTNRQLRTALKERDRRLQAALSGVDEVRREARRAKEGQREMLASFVSGGSFVGTPATAGAGAGGGGGMGGAQRATSGGIPQALPGGLDTISGPNAALQKRIKELEAEVASLKTDNVKQRTQVEKYKERFGQLKASAKAKKEAKAAAAAAAGAGAAIGGGGSTHVEEQ